jgi:uncharacterized protein
MGIFWSIALFSGLASSFHCVGMCGPIALGLPVGNLSHSKKLAARLLYNVGRTLTYSSLGFIFGFGGKVIEWAGFQQIISFCIGILLLLSTISFSKRFINKKFPLNLSHWVGRSFKKLIPIKHLSGFLGLGLVNGLLPCGMVYLALAGAIATGSAVNGAIFMAFFGLGTVPLMLIVSYLPNFLGLSFRRKINHYLPAYTFIFAVYFMVRGLGLPYLSPKLIANGSKSEITVCHSVVKK